MGRNNFYPNAHLIVFNLELSMHPVSNLDRMMPFELISKPSNKEQFMLIFNLFIWRDKILTYDIHFIMIIFLSFS